MSIEDAAAEAWLYFYPLLLMQVTRDAEKSLEMNVWKHADALRAHDFKLVIRPNVDTMYSHAWLDLSGGPVLLSVPDTGDRYYVVQAMDDWSLTFATVGTRTTGNRAGSFLFVPPGPQVPEDGGDATVVHAPTSCVWLLLRIQSDDPADVEPIRRLQSEFRLRAPGGGDKRGRAGAGSRVRPEVESILKEGTPPPQAVMSLEAPDFFRWASELWGRRDLGVPPADAELVATVKPLGLQPGVPLDWAALSEPQRAALERAKPRAIRRLATEAVEQGGANVDGWFYLLDNWYKVQDHFVLLAQPGNYALRTALALEALGFLPLEEATYLSAGVPRVGGEVLSGADGAAYTIRFPPGKLPPVHAFWSLTIYDGPGYLVDNPIGRYNLGSKDQLEADADGGVTIHLTVSNPHGAGSAKTSNWLPIPPGEFSVTFRAYWPTEPIVHGGSGWHMAPVQESGRG